jgi:hypothetical protein
MGQDVEEWPGTAACQGCVREHHGEWMEGLQEGENTTAGSVVCQDGKQDTPGWEGEIQREGLVTERQGAYGFME